MKGLNNLGRRIDKVMSVLLGTALGIMFVVITVQVFARYLFSYGIFWTDELARYLHIWTVVLCGGIVCADDSHIRMNVLEEIVPRLVRPCAAIRYIVAVFVGVAILYFSISLVETGLLSVSSNMRIPMAAVYICFPVSAVMIILYSLLNLINMFVKKGDSSSSESEGN